MCQRPYSLSGSPPHMRGKDHTGCSHRQTPGITPAHAGKSAAKKAGKSLAAGSPPHMRGKDKRNLSALGAVRITPAHAGKSLCCWSAKPDPWDHPRICGEKVSTLGLQQRSLGSPPHMRGKVSTFVHVRIMYRITPAHAGKSLKLFSSCHLK